MMGQDWSPVVLDKRGRRNIGEDRAEAVARAVRTGNAVAEARSALGTARGTH